MILSSELKKVTQFSTTDSAVLNKKPQKIRRDGFYFSSKENNVTVNSFAVPVFDHENVAIAAIVIAGSTHVVLENQGTIYIPVLKERAAQISAALNARKSGPLDRRYSKLSQAGNFNPWMELQ